MTRKGRSPLRLRTFLLLPLLAAAFGCSTGNEQFLDQRGAHPAGWVSGTGSSLHYVYASMDGGAACKPCHGDDLLGGISRVSCYSASWNGTACHAGGAAFHPLAWLDCTARGTNSWHATAYGNNNPPCATCHVLGEKCVLCHFDIAGRKVPVGSNWPHPEIEGHDAGSFADNASVSAVCVNCHETHNRFGHPPVCHNCHAPYP